jgi:AcrR family transcriptional regulator
MTTRERDPGLPIADGAVAPVARPPLALAGAPARERADAARNRRRILAAAEALVAERGIEKVSMEDVACAAGVGTGTLYRRFGDRAGLALALLDESTRGFQDALIAGPPPLGPGAPAADRLRAFGEGYFDLLERHADLLVVAVAPGRGADGPAVFFATHLAILLRDAAPHLDAEFTARALLAMLAPGEYVHARRRLGWSRERLAEGWRGVVGAICREPAAGR